MMDEIRQGLNFMKYALNHPWKFRSWVMAFMIGLVQAMVIILIETVNLTVLLTSNTIMDIIINFLAILILSSFDDFFFLTVSHLPLGKLLKTGEVVVGGDERKLRDILVVETTTSLSGKH